MDSLTSTQLRQIEQHRIRQLEQLDAMMSRRRVRLLPAVLSWSVQRRAVADDLAAIRAFLAESLDGR